MLRRKIGLCWAIMLLTFGICPARESTIQGSNPCDVLASWVQLANVGVPRIAAVANISVVQGKLYVIGSHESNPGTGRVNEEYDPVTNQWSLRAPYPRLEGRVALNRNAVANGEIYLFGGANIWNNYATNTVDKYNPSTDAWTLDVGTYSVPIQNLATVGIGNQIYCFGGNNYNSPSYLLSYRFDPANGSFTRLADTPTGRTGAYAVEHDGKIWVIGGCTYGYPLTYHPSVDIYDPSSDSWSAGPALPKTDWLYGSGFLSDGAFYAVYSEGGPAVYRLCSQSGIWEKIPTPSQFSTMDFGGVAFLGEQLHLFGGGNNLAGPHVALIVNSATTPPVAGQAIYHFDEGSGTIALDDSGAGNNGIITGATYVPGFLGSALHFSGGRDNVTVPKAVFNTFGNTAYFEARIRPSARAKTCCGGPCAATVFRKRGAYNDWVLDLEVDGSLTAVLSNDSGNDGVSIRTPAGLVTLGTWVKVAMWYDGASMRIYVNDIEAARNDKQMRLDWNRNYWTTEIGNDSFDIGIPCGDCDRAFVGDIDEVIISTTPPPANMPPTALICDLSQQSVGAGCMANVTLDGRCSLDPDNDPLTYNWTGPFGTSSGPTPTVTLPKGTHTITLTVNDGKGGTATDSVVVSVMDRTPPTINASPGPKTIYTGSAATTPMPDLTGEVRATDNCTAASALVISQTPPSGTPIGIGTTDVILRVEDASGNAASTTTTVSVSAATAVKLSDSIGNPIAGGVVKFYSGSWQSFGVTGSDGLAVKQIPFGNYTFRMSWAGGNNDKAQNIATAPMVAFQTVKAVVQLRDSTGAPIDTGTVQYYGGSWIPFGTTSGGQVSKELLPGTYSFRMTYAGISNDKAQNIAVDPTVIFRTTNVAVQLKNSSGAFLDPGTVQYYGTSWLSFGTTSGGQVSRELLPGTISFRMTYNGFNNDKQQNISLNPVVAFQTVRVTAQLLDSAGNPLDPGTVQYYASTWNAFGTTSGGQAQKELLPGTYSFRMIYGGFSNDKQQNVGTNSLVVFQTVLVRVQLADSAGNPLDTGTAQYYATAWNAFGTTSGGQTQRELLPGTYSFRMSYAGGSVDKVQNVGSTPVVQFQTGKVLSASGTCTSYYAGAWRTFVNGMELLPISYPFRFTGYPQTNYLIAAGATTNIY